MALKKFSDAYKTWWFWTAVALIFVYNSLRNMFDYGSRLFIVEYFGIFIASLIVVTIFYSIYYGLYKIFKIKK